MIMRFASVFFVLSILSPAVMGIQAAIAEPTQAVSVTIKKWTGLVNPRSGFTAKERLSGATSIITRMG